MKMVKLLSMKRSSYFMSWFDLQYKVLSPILCSFVSWLHLLMKNTVECSMKLNRCLDGFILLIKYQRWIEFNVIHPLKSIFPGETVINAIFSLLSTIFAATFVVYFTLCRVDVLIHRIKKLFFWSHYIVHYYIQRRDIRFILLNESGMLFLA